MCPDDDPAEAGNAAVLTYDARRCHVCGARHPAFGFGPPLTRPGHELWSCGTHRGEVERLVRGEKPVPTTQRGQLPLL